MINPITNPDAYDHILLGGIESVLCEVAGASSPRKWDEQKGYGSSGATIVYTGDGLANFAVKFMFYRTEDFVAWDAFSLQLAKSPSGAKPTALDIYHPTLEQLGIVSVVVEDVGQLTQVADGMWVIEVKFKQYRAPTPAKGKPGGSKSNGNTYSAGNAGANAAQLIKDLEKQMQGLLS